MRRAYETPPRPIVATRASRAQRFGAAVEVSAAAGFVERPTVAPDRAVYQHHRDDDVVYRLRGLPLAR